MYQEIGGEFYLQETAQTGADTKMPGWVSFGVDSCLLLSGRTALDFVIEDIHAGIRSAYLPSYCCRSVLQPFIEHGISLFFYEVVCTPDGLSYQINVNLDVDVFVATSYFGFSCTVLDAAIESFIRKGIVVIEDVTHRLFCRHPYSNCATYSIASLRKWLDIPCGGLAVKHRGFFKGQELKTSPLVETKIRAMRKKAAYVLEHVGDKQTYLDLFASFHTGLEKEYKAAPIDGLSQSLLAAADTDVLKRKRQENGRYLYKALKQNKEMSFLFSELSDQDCPLFIPIRVASGRRKALREHLIRSEIYCPIHWPAPHEITPNACTQRIYAEELSLVCDQRYGIEDMERMACSIEAFWSK